jgi:hypothetical protein
MTDHDHEPLTEDEGQVVADLWLARMAGLAGAVKPEYLPEAVSLCEKGWVERRWHGDDVVFWFTDAGLTALGVNAVAESVKGREN